MPGYVVAVGLPQSPPPVPATAWMRGGPMPEQEPEPQSGLRAAIVVEMGWAEELGSRFYIYAPQFEVGAKILYACSPYAAIAEDNGYLIIPLQIVMAWEPALPPPR